MKSNEELWREVRRVQAKVEKEIAEEERKKSNWHTGTPTEEGWYVLHYPKSEEQPYELARYDGECFIAVKPFHAIIVRIDVDTVPYWQKIEPYKEDEE